MTKIGEILIKNGFLNNQQLEEVLTCQKEQNDPIGKILIEKGYINEDQLALVLSTQLQLPFCRPAEMDLKPEILNLVPAKYAEKYQIIPIEFKAERLILATAEPLNLEIIDNLREVLGYKIKIAITSYQQILTSLKKYYSSSLNSIANVLADFDENELAQYQTNGLNLKNTSLAMENMANEAPIIRLVNTIISGALKDGASDIHLEPFEDEIKLRYRIDGVLQENAPPPVSIYPAVISRIKLMAGMDITERRLPQDGRIRLRVNNHDLDLRVAVIPTLHGEGIVMRLLNQESILLDLEQLGLGENNLKTLLQLIYRPHGMILVTGPTGSGKTTTLYAALQQLNNPSRKIITIEDPVEYQLKGINQIQVNTKLDFTFARGLRAIVRLDPDVILVGEIRDKETAEVAIQSALTGHLVLATLHTNDAASAFTRLMDMGVEEFLVASTVRGVLAQRLVRRICPYCKETYQPSAHEVELIAGRVTPLFQGVGCEHCKEIGYKGQVGLYELLTTTEAIERLVMNRSSAHGIREAALSQGMQTLRDDGLQKVFQGLTSLGEVVRVTQD